jgi:hypothetical protein
MKKSLFFAAALLALVACTREMNVDTLVGDMTITARTETSADTKTVVDGGTHVYWEPGDEIKVFAGGKSGKFTTDIAASSATATFNGTLGEDAWTEGMDLWAVYPYSKDAVFSDGTITTVLPSEQVARAGSFGKGMNLAIAHSTTSDLQFSNVGGGIRFTLAEEGIAKVTIEGLKGETLAGKVKVGFQDGKPAIMEVMEGKTAITLTPSEGETFAKDTQYFIVAIPGALEDGFKMCFRKADALGSRVFDKAIAIKRGIYGTLTHADEGATYTPVTSDNITFRDDLVKSLLVQHFDTNGDGEISYDEAASVQSFIAEGPGTRAGEPQYSVFAQSQITSFDELVYFTGLTEIESFAFVACVGLSSVTIPETVSAIGDYAFYYCQNLESITLTSTVPPTIGTSVLDLTGDCPIIVPEESVDAYVEAWSEYAHRITAPKPKNQIRYTSTDGQIVTPCNFDPTGAGRTPDPRDVFGVGIVSNEYAEGEGVIVFDGPVTDIGENAFAYCSNLASIELPESVTGIGDAAFFRCSSLVTITLPGDLLSIGRSAFKGCSSLEGIVIPGSVTSIGEETFIGCDALSSIVVKAGNKVYDSRDRCNAIIETATNTLVFGCATTEIPSGVTKIGDYAFQECTNLTYIYIPNGVKSIGKSAFAGCSGLDHVGMENSVTHIGYGAFMECTNLSSMGVSENLTDIEALAFAYCSSLVSIELPYNIKTIGDGAFAYCSALTEVMLWVNVERIGESAFYGCSGLRYIVSVALTPPKGGDNMFDGSTCLIYVPELSWGAYQTADKWSNYEIRIRPIGGGGDTIPDGAVDLGLPSGRKWAAWNVGASKPEEFGNYYAWGETAPKIVYADKTYKWGAAFHITKYNFDESYGIVDNKSTLDPEDDAAHVNWGKKWRTPNLNDFTELKKHCLWEWTSLNGVNGCTVTGPNGNSIFLPAAGWRGATRTGEPGYYSWDLPAYNGMGYEGRYWSNDLFSGSTHYPYNLYFNSLGQIYAGQNLETGFNRFLGFSVRPVWDETIE